MLATLVFVIVIVAVTHLGTVFALAADKPGLFCGSVCVWPRRRRCPDSTPRCASPCRHGRRGSPNREAEPETHFPILRSIVGHVHGVIAVAAAVVLRRVITGRHVGISHHPASAVAAPIAVVLMRLIGHGIGHGSAVMVLPAAVAGVIGRCGRFRIPRGAHIGYSAALDF